MNSPGFLRIINNLNANMNIFSVDTICQSRQANKSSSTFTEVTLFLTLKKILLKILTYLMRKINHQITTRKN